MTDLFWLTDEQMKRLRPFFLKSHGVSRVAWWFSREGSNGTARGHLLPGFYG